MNLETLSDRIRSTMASARVCMDEAHRWRGRSRGLPPVLWALIVSNWAAIVFDLLTPTHRLAISFTAMVLAFAGLFMAWQAMRYLKRANQFVELGKEQIDLWYRLKFEREPPKDWAEHARSVLFPGPPP